MTDEPIAERPRVAADPAYLLVLVCFFLSGFAALLYETAWTREFAAVFGTSELAVVSVLAAYMAGLAAGAAVAGRFADRVRRPVLVYGVLEALIALCALAVPSAIRAATVLHGLIFGVTSGLPAAGSAASTVFYLACSFAIVVVPTGLMGATLPMLARFAVRREEQIGPRVGALYATNTFGAIAGTLSAAFLLLPAVGLRQTVYAGALTNGLVFALAALLARRAAPVASPVHTAARAPRFHWILPFVAVSGVTSFSYEVLWTRLLGHVLGGSVNGFATMLASFLLGIALGSAVAARLATTRLRAARGFAAAQIGIAVLSLAAFAGLDVLPAIAQLLGAGAHGAFAANILVAAAVLLPSALCVGATFPFAVRVFARDESQAAPVSARVYAWNTAGAIVGVLAAGYLLIPALGYAATVVAAASVNVALAAGTALLTRPRLKFFAGAAVAVAVVIAMVRPGTPWAVLRASPAFATSGDGDVVFYAVGPAATVLLLEDPEVGEWRLRTNGLPESSIQRPGGRAGKYAIGRWLGALPVLARPETRSLLVIGLGGGLVLEAVPPSVDSIDVVELEAEVVAANRAIASERRRDPLADPRVRVHLNDVRGALAQSSARFDAIVSQPSHPWTAGASHLYTREFFALAREHLEPGGTFVQWINLSLVDEALLRTLVATLTDSFPHVEILLLTAGDLLFVASDEPIPLFGSASRALAADPTGFRDLGVWIPEDVEAMRVLDDSGARKFARGEAPNTDDHNLLATRSSRILGATLGIAAGEKLLAPSIPLLRAAPDVDRMYVVRRLIGTGGVERAEVVARSLRDPVARQAAIAHADLGRGRVGPGTRRLEAAAKRAPKDIEVRAALLRIRREGIARGETADPPIDRAIRPAEDAVISGWRYEHAKNWSALRALEGALAAIPRRDPLHPDAARLRARWRIESGDRRLAGESVELIDDLLAVSSYPFDFLLRAEAAARAGDTSVALATLVELTRAIAPVRTQRFVARRLRAALESIPDDGTGEASRRALDAWLEQTEESPGA